MTIARWKCSQNAFKCNSNNSTFFARLLEGHTQILLHVLLYVNFSFTICELPNFSSGPPRTHLLFYIQNVHKVDRLKREWIEFISLNQHLKSCTDTFRINIWLLASTGNASHTLKQTQLAIPMPAGVTRMHSLVLLGQAELCWCNGKFMYRSWDA